MVKKTRVAVFGAGAIAQRRHLPEYANRSDVELVALVDPKLERATSVAEYFKIPHVFPDYRQALKLKPDAVSVCSPCAFHAKQTIDSLKIKAHVLCEKPMAASVKEARGMIAAAKSASRQLMVAHNQRFAAGHIKGKEIYQSGMLGKCLGFSITFAHPGPETWSVDWGDCHFFKKKYGVLGSLADLGVHKLDLLRWLLEDEIVEVAAMSGTLAKKKCDVEDTAFAVLRTKKGAIGQLFAGWIRVSGGDNATLLFCEKGTLRLENDPQFPVIAELPRGEGHYIKTKAIQTNEAGGQYGSGVIDSFVSCIRSGKKVPVPGEEGARSLAAVMACAEAAKKRKVVAVENI